MGHIVGNFLSALALGVFGFTSITCQATPGDLDPSFNDTGTFRGGVQRGYNNATGIAPQADGKLVVAGSSTNAGYSEIAVARYNTDGSLDATFARKGAAFISNGRANVYGNAVAIQSDGKIVVAGHDSSYDQNGNEVPTGGRLVRLNPDGSLDPSFALNGTVLTSISAANAIVLQSDGKIIIAGLKIGPSPNYIYNFAVARFNSDGTPDTSFNGTGVATATIGSYDELHAVTLQTDGKIVGAGQTYIGGKYAFAVVRFSTSGILDTAFGSGGKVTTQLGTNSSTASAIVMQGGVTAAKILIAGGADGKFAIARYNVTDGSLDTTFNTTGKVTTAVGTSFSSAASILVQYQSGRADRIIVGGSAASGPFSHFAAAKYLISGALDTAFDGDGKLTTALTAYQDESAAMVYQSGNIILAGYSGGNGGLLSFALARHSANSGAIDPTFNSNGIRIDNVSDGGGIIAAAATSLVIQADGKLVVGGTLSTAPPSLALMRLNVDGSLDPSFNTSGTITNNAAVCNALALQSDGKIVVAGTGGNEFALVRYTPVGTLDIFKTTPVGAGSAGSGNAVAVQPDGRILIAGSGTGSNNEVDFGLVRYNVDGSLDTSFGVGGVVTTSFGGSAMASAMTLQKDGKIVLAGGSVNPGSVVAARYNPDGSLDTSFSFDGKVITPIGPGPSYARAIASQTDGKIVIAGSSMDSSSNELLTLLRYNNDGSLDPTFGNNGIVTAAIGTGVANAMTLQSDGKILVGGYMTLSDGSRSFELLRYKSDGSLDSAYGNGGITLVKFPTPFLDCVGAALALDPLGRAVIAGDANGLFGVARVLGDPFVKITSIARRPADGHIILDGLALPGIPNSLQQATTLGSTAFSFLSAISPGAAGNWEVDLGVQTAPHFYRLTSP